jgi:methylmalonyl-CoA/ethylmalonyl-CoA epimerase
VTESPAALFPRGLFQIAIVVRDLDAAMKTFMDVLGAGEFRMLDSTTRKVYRGRPIDPVHRIAAADFGPVTVELIQPVSGESLFTEFLAKHGEGVHHLGFMLASNDDYERALTHLAEAGFPSAQSGRKADLSYDYVDTEPALGTYVELVWHASEPGTDEGQSSGR